MASGCIQLGFVTVAVTGRGLSDVIFSSLKHSQLLNVNIHVPKYSASITLPYIILIKKLKKVNLTCPAEPRFNIFFLKKNTADPD